MSRPCSEGTCVEVKRDEYRCVEPCDPNQTLSGQCSDNRDCQPYTSATPLVLKTQPSPSEFDVGMCDFDGIGEVNSSCHVPSDCALGLTCTAGVRGIEVQQVGGDCRPICDLSDSDNETCTPFNENNEEGFDLGYEREL